MKRNSLHTCIIEEWKGPDTAKGITRFAPKDFPSLVNLSISALCPDTTI